MTSRPKMKGIGFSNIQMFVVERAGKRAWDEIVDSTSTPMVFRGLVAVGWYDVELFAEVLKAMEKRWGGAILREAGEFEALNDYNRLLRLTIRALSPLTVFNISSRLWRQFQDSGQWTFRKVAPTTLEGELKGWASHRVLCEELVGYMGRLLYFTGGKNVTITHPCCTADGKAVCLFRYTWE